MQLFVCLEVILINHEVDATVVFHRASKTLLRVEDQVSLFLFLLTQLFLLSFELFFSREFFFATFVLFTTLIFFRALPIFFIARCSCSIIVSTSPSVLRFSFPTFSFFRSFSLSRYAFASLIFISNLTLFRFLEHYDLLKLGLVSHFSTGNTPCLLGVDASQLLDVLLTTVLFLVLETYALLLELLKRAFLRDELIIFRLASISFSLCRCTHRSLCVCRTNLLRPQSSFHLLFTPISISIRSGASIHEFLFEIDDRVLKSGDLSLGVAATLIFLLPPSQLFCLHVAKFPQSFLTATFLRCLTILFLAFETSAFVIYRASDVFEGLFPSKLFSVLETTFFIKFTGMLIIPSSSTSFFSGTIGSKLVARPLQLRFSFSTTSIFLVLQS